MFPYVQHSLEAVKKELNAKDEGKLPAPSDVEERHLDSSSVDKDGTESSAEASVSVAGAVVNTITPDQIFDVMGEFGHVSFHKKMTLECHLAAILENSDSL